MKDGRKLDIKVVLSLHELDDGRVVARCRNFVHSNDESLTDDIMEDRKDYLGIAELVLTDTLSVVDTETIVCKQSNRLALSPLICKCLSSRCRRTSV